MPLEPTNPFQDIAAASRYAQGRPDFHALVISKIRDELNIADKLDRALDVGCGTGLSTRALRDLAKHVDGIDTSAAMLAAADELTGVTYQRASAEELPFSSACFDLITVSSALHWFDRGRFWAEAARVMKQGAHLVSYENGFAGVMLSNPDFQPWQQQFYQRFPRTPRNNSPLTDEELARHGLKLTTIQTYTNTVEFTLPELSLYLSTQSNAIEAIQKGHHSVSSYRELIEQEAAPYFAENQPASFEFQGSIRMIVRVD